ncbi:MAG: Peptide chain release factor 2, partial [candidate division TM6 bacterium GW2011_GWF2_30_66]
MLIAEELLEKLKNAEPDVSIIQTYWNNSNLENKFQELELKSKDENFWKNPNQAEILKELSNIKHQREKYLYIVNTYKDLPELIELFSQDQEELEKIKQDTHKLIKEMLSFKASLLLNEPEDKSNCFLNINSGAGGTESQDWAHMLLRMYVRFCEREDFTVTIMDYQQAEEAGIKSATLFIKGKNAYGILKGERGIHRLVRISPFDSNK